MKSYGFLTTTFIRVIMNAHLSVFQLAEKTSKQQYASETIEKFDIKWCASIANGANHPALNHFLTPHVSSQPFTRKSSIAIGYKTMTF